MSEFKYACPVCGQHMMCDVSQAGSVMQCPTCFQKITAPQAPAAGSKFILTGTQVSEKKITARGYEPVVPSSAEEKNFPTAMLVSAFVVVLVVGATLFVFREKIFPPKKTASALKAVVAVTNVAPPPKPAPVAPPASDTNWMLTLDDAVVPDTTASGRIHGQDFIIGRAIFQNGTLTLRDAAHGPIQNGLQINFSGALPETLAGQSLNIIADTNKSARVTLLWRDADGTMQKTNYVDSYAMRLEFGALADNHLPGKIYLCLPDVEKSYLMGTFTADARKPKPKPPNK
jgi:DNA-directed RNA polymerase subunit RPC12/RpoP